MPAVFAALEYLQKLDLYNHEKPYWLYVTPRQELELNTQLVNNLEFETWEGILIQDIRQMHTKADINECGFQVIPHESTVRDFSCKADIQAYKDETEWLLQKTFAAVHVKCYDTVLRKNVTFDREQIDLADPLRIEGPAMGVHNGNLSLGIRRPGVRHMTDTIRHYCQIWTRSDLKVLVQGGDRRISETRLSYPNHQVSP